MRGSHKSPRISRVATTDLLPARQARDRLAGLNFLLFSLFPVLLLFALVVGLTWRAWPILQVHSLSELLTGVVWKPLQGLFGFLPFILGTLWVTLVALLLAVPPCLLTSIYLAEYARPRLRETVKPLLDLLAAIPSVVYGVWGMVAIVPVVQKLGAWLVSSFGQIPLLSVNNPTGFSILAGGIVLAVMIAPFIIAVTYEILLTVPAGTREASLALGSTRWQTIKSAVLPVTLPGIIAGIVLGASRALGETMAVLMVVGNLAQIPHSIFDAAYPLPALIANNYGEMMSIPLYDAALLGAALLLLMIVLITNLLSTMVLRQIKRNIQII